VAALVAAVRQVAAVAVADASAVAGDAGIGIW
jgi:hypothetical protein